MEKIPFRAFADTPITYVERKLNNWRLAEEKEKYIKKRVASIGGGYQGTAQEYKEVVLKYWAKYGQKPSHWWYNLFCDGQGKFDPRYITDPIWICSIIPYFNDMKMRLAYDDKGFYHRLFPDVKMPQTVVKQMGGYYYNGDGEELISREEAVRLIQQEQELIFKKSIYSWGGKGIDFYTASDEKKSDVNAILNSFQSNFVAQRIVRQHPDLSRVNRDSLNTVRVITFHFKEQIHFLSAQLRIGGVGARVDNVSAGGCACSVKPDGWLQEKAIARSGGWTDTHASGIKFKDICVPSFDRVVQTAKRLHTQLPHFNIVGWDFSIDEAGDPVLIELNFNPGQNQIGSKQPTFGDMSEEVFDEVFRKKTLR